MGILPYIHHSNTRDIIARIDTAWRSEPADRRIIPVLGHIGTGKRALLEYYTHEHRKQMSGIAFQHTPIALADIREAERAKSKRGAYVTTAAFNAFSEIVYALGETAERLGKKPDYNRWFMPAGGQYTDHQFNSLYNFVRTEFRVLGAHALILLHANHLDQKAFEMLRRWYDWQKRQFVLVLSFTMEKAATVSETLRNFYKAIPEGWADEPQEVQKLTRQEFANNVMGGVLAGLHITPPADNELQLQLVRRFWGKTGGDWHAIDLRARDLRIAVSKHSGATREITPEILDRVFGPLPTKSSQKNDAQSNPNAA